MTDSFSDARAIEVDLLGLCLKSERRAWLVAGGASVLALALGIGLAVVGATKTSVPYVFEVDKGSGAVQLLSVGDESFHVSNQELVDKSNLQRYVLARESYFYKLLQQDYETVLALSAEDVGLEYAKAFDGPEALDKKLGASITRKVNIISISLSSDTGGFSRATVRFSRTEQSIGRQSSRPEFFIATLAFEYKPPLFGKEKDLLKNPLGFKAIQYRVDPEITQPDTAPQAPTPAPTSPMAFGGISVPAPM